MSICSATGIVVAAGAKSRTTESLAVSEERYAREREVSMKTIATPVVIFPTPVMFPRTEFA